jgi:hypothetical protein
MLAFVLDKVTLPNQIASNPYHEERGHTPPPPRAYHEFTLRSQKNQHKVTLTGQCHLRLLTAFNVMKAL